MDKFLLTSEEQEVFDQIAKLMTALPDASQYMVLRNVAHAMGREICRPGATRAAAAVAGSTARASVENSKANARKRANPKNGSGTGYTDAFKNHSKFAPLFAKQAALRAALSVPPTEEQRKSLRDLSETIRDGFRGFNTVEEKETA
jgi:hypothetical protein